MDTPTFMSDEVTTETPVSARQSGTQSVARGLRPSQVPVTESAASSPFSAGGKISFKTGELESPKGPAGPFEVFVSVGFEVEVEIGPGEAGAEGGSAGAQAGEAERGWEFRAGPSHNLGKAEDQGVKAELEHALSEQWPGILESLRPDKVKTEGELTGEGGELSLGGKWGDEPVNYELKLTVIGGKWEEGKVHVLDIGLTRNVEASWKIPLRGADFEVTVKALVTAHVEPDWERIAIWLAEEGVTAGAASAALGVAVAYVAFVGFGLYEMDRAALEGKGRMMGFNFAEGYAEELAAATESSPLGRGDEVALLDEEAQRDFNAATADYLADRISVFDAAARAKRAGRACLVQAMGNVLADSGVDGWRRLSARHRELYGISQKSRYEYYMTTMIQQVMQSKPAGIELNAPLVDSSVSSGLESPAVELGGEGITSRVLPSFAQAPAVAATDASFLRSADSHGTDRMIDINELDWTGKHGPAAKQSTTSRATACENSSPSSTSLATSYMSFLTTTTIFISRRVSVT